MRARERGAVAPLLAALVVVTALGLGAAAQLGNAAVRSARVQVHADATALAAVSDGEGVAAAALARSGALLIDTTLHAGGEQTVEVELDGVRARATAAPLGAPLGHDR